MSEAQRVALLPGDGIGQEVVPAAGRVLAALCEAGGRPLELVTLELGWETFEKRGTALPEATVEGLKQCQGALMGAVGSPSHEVPGYASPVLALRTGFELYANLRPLISAPVRESRADVDLLVVRENTEGLYSGRERWEDGGATAIAERVITRRASERIAHKAFEEARRRGGRKGRPPQVTVVHKANVLRASDGLFRQTALGVAADYPEVLVEDQLVDSMVYRLILEPQAFDVIVAPNLYGDILSDAGAALVGGLGLAPSANLGEDFVLAEPVHGSAPDIAGRGIANPVATLRAGILLLQHLERPDEAALLDAAIDATLLDGPKTPDLGGRASTLEVTEAVLGELRGRIP